MVDLLACDRAILFLLDERKRELVSRSSGGDDDYPIRLPLGEGLLSQVVRTGRRAQVDDFSLSNAEADWDATLSYKSKSALAAPLKNNLSRTIGVLLVLNRKDGNAFDDEDSEILSVLAKQAAIAIDNSRPLGDFDT